MILKRIQKYIAEYEKELIHQPNSTLLRSVLKIVKHTLSVRTFRLFCYLLVFSNLAIWSIEYVYKDWYGITALLSPDSPHWLLPKRSFFSFANLEAYYGALCSSAAENRIILSSLKKKITHVLAFVIGSIGFDNSRESIRIPISILMLRSVTTTLNITLLSSIFGFIISLFYASMATIFRNNRIAGFIDFVFELQYSMPAVLFLYSIWQFIPVKNRVTIVFVIALVSWTSIYDMLRSSMVNIANSFYTRYAKKLGLKTTNILFYYVLPNLLVDVAIIFPKLLIRCYELEGLGFIEHLFTYGGLSSNVSLAQITSRGMELLNEIDSFYKIIPALMFFTVHTGLLWMFQGISLKLTELLVNKQENVENKEETVNIMDYDVNSKDIEVYIS